MFISGSFNAALGQPTQQSSTMDTFKSDRAVDGNDNRLLIGGGCSLTTATPLTWWFVDLGRVYTVISVRITPTAITQPPLPPQGTKVHQYCQYIHAQPHIHYLYEIEYSNICIVSVKLVTTPFRTDKIYYIDK